MSEEAKKAAIEQIVKSENYPVAFYRETHALTVGAGRGWDAHASHTAAIREKAEALMAKVRESCFQECSNPSAEDLQIAEDYGLEHNDEVCACPCHKFDPQLTALKDELEKGNG